MTTSRMIHDVAIAATKDLSGFRAHLLRHTDFSALTGGESSIWSTDGENLITTTLTEPGDILLNDDRRTLHGVTALEPERPEQPGHRDVLTMAHAAR